MTKLVTACVQMRASDDVDENIGAAQDLIAKAASNGAQFVATPEMTNIMDIRRGAMREKAVTENEDSCLEALRDQASRMGVWLLIGSLGLKLDDQQRVNRSFLISPEGAIKARYDKIHMFDVDVGDGQSYRESKAYRAGKTAVVAGLDHALLGLSVCYDVRFANLYRTLAQAGAQILTVPAAFTRVTGEAHWHVLLRARAIETGSFVVAPAQGGKHTDGRETFGHSLIINPWGEIIAEGGVGPEIVMAELDLEEVEKARRKIPSLTHDREFELLRMDD